MKNAVIATVLTLAALALAACSNGGSVSNPLPNITPSPVPTLYSSTPTFTTFVAGTAPGLPANAKLTDIVVGTDGNVWFTDARTTRPAIGKIDASGNIVEYTAGLPLTARPHAMVVGPDGDLWFADPGTPGIGKISPDGTIVEYTAGLSANDRPGAIAQAHGGLYFMGSGGGAYIGHVDADGTITELTQLPTTTIADGTIVGGPDGNLWFTDKSSSVESVSRYVPGGTVTDFPTGMKSVFNPCCVYVAPKTMVLGPDGDIWFTNIFYSPQGSPAHPIVKATTGGMMTAIVPPSDSEFVSAIALGRDGNLWFAGEDPFYSRSTIGTMDVNGDVKIFGLPHGLEALALAYGLDGSLYMTASTGPQSAIVKVTL